MEPWIRDLLWLCVAVRILQVEAPTVCATANADAAILTTIRAEVGKLFGVDLHRIRIARNVASCERDISDKATPAIGGVIRRERAVTSAAQFGESGTGVDWRRGCHVLRRERANACIATKVESPAEDDPVGTKGTVRVQKTTHYVDEFAVHRNTCEAARLIVDEAKAHAAVLVTAPTINRAVYGHRAASRYVARQRFES